MNTAELLDQSVDVYKKSFLVQLAYSAIVSVTAFVLIFVVGIIAVIIFAFFAGVFYGIGFDANMATSTIVVIAVGAVLFFVPLLMLWQALYSAGHILLAKQAFYGEKVRVNVEQLPKVALRVLSSFAAQILLFVLMLLVLGLIFFVFAIVFGLLMYPAPLTAGGYFWLGFGLVVALVVGLGYWIFSNVFSLSVAVAIFEKRLFFGTITRSWQLVKGEFWKILAIRTLWFVATMVIYYSLYGVVNLLSVGVLFLADFFGFAGIVIAMLFNWVTIIVSFVMSFAIMPLGGIVQAVIYFNQRIKKEGLDIEERLERLGS